MIRIKECILIIVAAAFILSVPLIAMRFTDEVAWDRFDFAVAWFVLVSAGLMYKFATRNAPSLMYRVAVGVAVATALILVWMNLAVGLIGSEDNPANLMYGGVLAVGLIGAVIGRFRPHGMARALFATALAQALVPVIALIVWKPPASSTDALLGILGVFAVNALFVALFILSGLLFRRASGTPIRA